MKIFLILLMTSFFAAETFACECDKEILNVRKPVQSYIKKNYGVEVDLNRDIKWSAYYPGLLERLFAGQMRGTSCEGHGPRNELYLMCQNSRKSDYIVTLPDTNCTVKLRVKANFKRVKIRELHSSCKI